MSKDRDDGDGEVSPDDVDARGTLFFLGVYLMLLFGMWGAMYWIMVSR